jgi:hypothetical protein
MKTSRILLILGILLVIAGVSVSVLSFKSETVPNEGSLIPGPVGELYTDDLVTFRYRANLGTTYIHPVEWPPKATVTKDPQPCVAGRSEVGETSEVQVYNRTYCRTVESEGAAGSIYTSYTYSAEVEGSAVSLSFTLRTPQCANYDDPQKTACEEERANFSPDELADRILQTVALK